jgi:hypothetical protein
MVRPAGSREELGIDDPSTAGPAGDVLFQNFAKTFVLYHHVLDKVYRVN